MIKEIDEISNLEKEQPILIYCIININDAHNNFLDVLCNNSSLRVPPDALYMLSSNSLSLSTKERASLSLTFAKIFIIFLDTITAATKSSRSTIHVRIILTNTPIQE